MIPAFLIIAALGCISLIEFKVKSRWIRVITVSMVALIIAITTARIGIEIGRSIEGNHFRLHLGALFNDLAYDARENRTDMLKTKIEKVHRNLPAAVQDEASLARLLMEIENFGEVTDH